MSGNLFRTLFILLFTLKILIKLLLDGMNYFYIKKNATVIPVELKNLIESTKILEINSYNRAKISFRLVYFLFNSLMLFVFLFSPLYSMYTTWLSSSSLPYVLKGLIFFLLLNFMMWLLDLPFNYFFYFRIEASYGFNKYTVIRWSIDELKGLVISSVLTIIILSFIFGIWGDNFVFKWGHVLIGWSISLVLVVLFMYLVPLVLIPFFYKLKPIEDQKLQADVQKLFKKTGFNVRGIFQADESTKSAHANAMITGIGKSKTIILFDTLLENYSHQEVLAVIAHEIGHGKKKHLLKLMILTIFELFLFILFASYLLSMNFPYQAMGITTVLYSGAFFIYILFFDLITFFMKPFFSSFSRTLEYEADQFSKQLLGSAEPLISTFQKFIANELESINLHPFYETFYYSHPTLLRRIRALK